MPSVSGPRDQQGDLRIVVAPLIEFHFGLFLITKHTIDPLKTVPQWVIDVSEEHADLVREFGAFWSERGLYDLPIDGCYREHGEVLVAAWRSGHLLSNDPEAFLASLPRTLSESFATPPLESEPPAVWNLVDRRLAYLREHAADRKRYCELSLAFWRAICPYWEEFGRADAERAARDLSARARNDDDLRNLLPGNTFLHKDDFQPQIREARSRGELVVVPMGLAGSGQLYWALPGLSLVGVGLQTADRPERRRERSERAANRFKVLSDPTRVAILFELLRPSHNAATVTELASLFGLSQPTVSVHIKLLREAGLIQAQRDGNQVHYEAEEAVTRGFVNEALEDIVGPMYPPS